MSNVKAPPAWLTPAVVSAVANGTKHAGATNALRTIGLTGQEIVTIERIAAVQAVTPEQCAGDLVRAAIDAINVGGWHVGAR